MSRRLRFPRIHAVARISEGLGIIVANLYKCRKAWRLWGDVVPALKKDPEGWNAMFKLTVVR